MVPKNKRVLEKTMETCQRDTGVKLKECQQPKLKQFEQKKNNCNIELWKETKLISTNLFWY